MATAQVSERRARYAEALLFWAITLVVCAGAGYGSYRYGRSWIGDRLGSDVKSVLTSDQLSSRVTSEAFDRAPSVGESDAAEEPPKEAVVEVQAASIDGADKAKLEAEKSGTRRAAGPAEPDESAKEGDTERATSARDEDKPAAKPDKDAERPARAEPKPHSVRAPEVPEGGGRFVVRAGSFRKRDNADGIVKELRAKGYAPYVTTVLKDGEEYTRVNVGSYEDRDDALKLRGELRGEGYPDASVATE